MWNIQRSCPFIYQKPVGQEEVSSSPGDQVKGLHLTSTSAFPNVWTPETYQYTSGDFFSISRYYFHFRICKKRRGGYPGAPAVLKSCEDFSSRIGSDPGTCPESGLSHHRISLEPPNVMALSTLGRNTQAPDFPNQSNFFNWVSDFILQLRIREHNTRRWDCRKKNSPPH